MKTFAVLTSALLLPALGLSQGDTVTLTNGKVLEDVNVKTFSIRELVYAKSGHDEAPVPSDQIAKVEFGKFKDVFKRGLADRDPQLIFDEAQRQKKANNLLMAQAGYVEAARLFFAGEKDSSGVAALEELQKEMPDQGMVADVYRLKFDAYMSLGNASGFQSATTVARKYQSDATTNAWPQGFAIEADFFAAVAEGANGGDPRNFQAKMRDIAGRAATNSPMLAARANVQLAHSLRANGDGAGAEKLYRDVVERGVADDTAMGGAYLGLGLLTMGRGDAANREPYRDALLLFLRVRLETKAAPESLQAEALYNGMLAAEKWGGQDFRTVQGRCRYVLLNNFPNSEWAARARGQ